MAPAQLIIYDIDCTDATYGQLTLLHLNIADKATSSQRRPLEGSQNSDEATPKGEVDAIKTEAGQRAVFICSTGLG